MQWVVTCVLALTLSPYIVLSHVNVSSKEIIQPSRIKNVTMSPMNSSQSANKVTFLLSSSRTPSSKTRTFSSLRTLSPRSKLLSSTSRSSSSPSSSVTSKQTPVKHSSRVFNDVAVTNSYDVMSWLQKPTEPRAKANLTILPILAILAFLVMLCLKGCTWFRESMKDKDRDSIDADNSFMIVHEGDKDYNDIDFRSDLSTPYDTYSSYMSFLRRNNNYDTVNSIRSLQGSRNYDTVTSYRSMLQQRLENPNDSVASYQAFLQRVKAMKDVEVQVECLDEKPYDRNGSLRRSRRQQRNENGSPKLRSKHFNHNVVQPVLGSLMETSYSSGSAVIEKHDVGVGNGVITRDESKEWSPKNHYRKSPTRLNRSRSPVKHRYHSSPVRRTGSPTEISNYDKTKSVASHPTEALTSDATTCTESSDVTGALGTDKTASSKETSANIEQSSKTAKTASPVKKCIPRFRVSFVTDDESDVKSQNSLSFPPDQDKLSPISTNKESKSSK